MDVLQSPQLKAKCDHSRKYKEPKYVDTTIAVTLHNPLVHCITSAFQLSGHRQREKIGGNFSIRLPKLRERVGLLNCHT
jgi:hypothetical protein